MITTITTFFAGLALTISGFFGGTTFGAQPALTVPQGGTGWSNIQGGTVLYGTGSGLRLATTSTTTASCAGTASCSDFVIFGSSPVTITGSGGAGSTDAMLWANASTSPLSVLSLNANASSSIAYLSVYSATTTNATTTNQGVSYVTALGSGGITLNSSNGTQVAQLGAGGGSNATFLGGVNIDGTTRLATSLTGILKATAGTVSVATAGTDYANFAWPYTPATSWVSTSTIVLNTAGIMSTASSSIAFLDSVRATSTNHISTNATTSILSASTHIRSAGSLRVDNLTSALTLTGTTGTFAEYAGTSCTNQFVRSIDALGAATCATVSSSDVSLANLTATDTTLTFSGTYNGSTARTIGINLGNSNAWTALQTFNTAGLISLASSTVAFLDSTRATSTSFISTNATTTQQYIGTHLYVAGTTRLNVTSAMLSATSGGVVQSTTVSSPLSFSGSTLSCSTCATFGFPWTPATSWTATSTLMLNTGGWMSTASSSLSRLAMNYATATETFALPIAANPFTQSDGQCAIDTTVGQLRCDIGTQGERVVTHPEGLFPMVVSFASTSLNTSTTTRYLGPAPQALTFQKAQCDSSKHLSFSLYDGTNRADFIIASSTIGTTTFSTNRSFYQGESIRMDIGTTTSAAINVTAACTLWFTYDKQ